MKNKSDLVAGRFGGCLQGRDEEQSGLDSVRIYDMMMRQRRRGESGGRHCVMRALQREDACMHACALPDH